MPQPSDKHSSQHDRARHAERPPEPERRAEATGPHADILALQRTAGNRAVSALVQSGEDDIAPFANVPPEVQTALNDTGQPLEPVARAEMEARLGHDFGQVRLHTNGRAAESARAVEAQAYTLGHDVVFAQGQYAPETPAGKHLLAHELAHVAQQKEAPPTAPADVQMGHPGDAFEQAAELAADLALQDIDRATAAAQGSGAQPNRAPATGLGRMSRPVLQRQPKGAGAQPKQFFLTPNDIKNEIKKRNSDLYELIKTHPLQGGTFVQVKEAALNGQKHVWELAISIEDLGPLASYKGITAEVGASTKKVGKSDVITHRIASKIDKRQATKDSFLETLFHELTHARILIDKNLPPDQQSATYQSYETLSLVAGTPLLIKQNQAVKRALDKIGRFYDVFVQKDVSKKLPTDLFDEVQEFLINEKFTGEASDKAFGKSPSNKVIATRYARAVADKVQRYVRPQVNADVLKQALTDHDDKLEQATEELAKEILALYEQLDAEMKVLENIRKSLGSAPATPGAPSPTPLPTPPDKPAPLDITGNPIKMP